MFNLYMNSLQSISDWAYDARNDKPNFSGFPVLPTLENFPNCYRYVILSQGLDDQKEWDGLVELKSQLDFSRIQEFSQSWSKTKVGAKCYLSAKPKGYYAILIKADVFGVDLGSYAESFVLEFKKYISLFELELTSAGINLNESLQKIEKLLECIHGVSGEEEIISFKVENIEFVESVEY
jgi:hypothetical protein